MFEIQDFINFNASGRAYCPSCSRKKGRRPSQKSLALLDSGAYKCHAGCTPEEIRDSLGIEKTSSLDLANQNSPLIYTPDQLQTTTDWLLNGNDGKRGQAQQWLKNRGITPELIQHYRLGLVTHHGRAGIVIPIPADDQDTRYYRKFRIEPWSYRPTWSQKGLPAMVYFTHKPKAAKQTYLCEGEWDAILLGWAMRDDTKIAISTFTCGCNVIPPTEQLQRLPGPVTIFYDLDPPGQKGAEKLALQLGHRAKIAQVPFNQTPIPKGWDISDALNADCSLSQIKAAARQATRPNHKTHDTRLNYEQCLEKIDEILQIEDTARQLWELNRLAKRAELSTAQLRKIHQTRLECARPFAPMDVVDFLARAPESREWIIAGKIPKASTIALIADGGTGKSRLSYDLAYAVASGQSWNGFRTTQGKVLIIQTDEPDVDFSDSLRDANYEQFQPGMVQVETEWQFSQLPQLTRWIEQEQPTLVIIDSFTAANRASELAEKDTNYGACIYDLRNIANTYGCTFLILHHTNKLGESRGTTAIPDNVSEVWYLRHPKPEDNLPEDQRIWSINKSRSRCSGKFVISYDPDDCVIVYHGDFKCTPQGQGGLEGRLLDHFQHAPGIAFEIAELALQFSCSESHMRRLVKRLWRQGHITEGIREVDANNGRGGKSRKKIFTYPESDDQVTETQARQGLVSDDPKSTSSDQVTTTTIYHGSLSSDHPIAQTRDSNGRELAVQGEQVPKSHSEQGSVSLDHHHQRTGVSPPAPDLKEGDWVELLTGYFTGRQVQVVGFPRKKPGWVEVKGKAWLITKEYERQDVRLIRRATP
ncbi:AAA family ATPase [Acaryochloris marina]|uniref:AAA family ATPase n=1 Tax=Acaryochloris marina TaxID=155978 RepID=UPI00059FF54B|nr:AAA family ATPase [Acaryochloris marina]